MAGDQNPFWFPAVARTPVAVGDLVAIEPRKAASITLGDMVKKVIASGYYVPPLTAYTDTQLQAELDARRKAKGTKTPTAWGADSAIWKALNDG